MFYIKICICLKNGKILHYNNIPKAKSLLPLAALFSCYVFSA